MNHYGRDTPDLGLEFYFDSTQFPDPEGLERIEIMSGADVLTSVLNRTNGDAIYPNGDTWNLFGSYIDAETDVYDVSNLSLELEDLTGVVTRIPISFTWTDSDRDSFPSSIYSQYFQGAESEKQGGTLALAIPTAVWFSVDTVNRNIQLQFSIEDERISIVDVYFYHQSGGIANQRVFATSHFPSDINLDGTLNTVIYQEGDISLDGSLDFDDITHVKINTYDQPSNTYVVFEGHYQMGSYSTFIEKSP
jgi:hypothetical protein